MINTMKSLLALCLFYSAASVSTAETPIKHTSFRPGEIWTDNNGAHINAHGGGILYDKGTYYWYGEHKVEGDAGNYAQVGVHCYSGPSGPSRRSFYTRRSRDRSGRFSAGRQSRSRAQPPR